MRKLLVGVVLLVAASSLAVADVKWNAEAFGAMVQEVEGSNLAPEASLLVGFLFPAFEGDDIRFAAGISDESDHATAEAGIFFGKGPSFGSGYFKASKPNDRCIKWYLGAGFLDRRPPDDEVVKTCTPVEDVRGTIMPGPICTTSRVAQDDGGDLYLRAGVYGHLGMSKGTHTMIGAGLRYQDLGQQPDLAPYLSLTLTQR